MLQNEVSKELVLHFAEVLKERYPYDLEENRSLIKKGFLLYRQGSVYNVKFLDEKVLGRVQDVVPVEVIIDLTSIESSSCSCSNPHFCRHRMALFLYIYSSVGRVGSLLDEWKTVVSGNTPSPLPHSLMRAKDLKKQFSEDSLTSWLAFFDREYESFLDNHLEKDRYIISVIYQRFFQSLVHKAPKKMELKRLYRIHAGIFCIEKAIHLVSQLELNSYQFDSYVTPYVHNLVDTVIDDLSNLQLVSLSFSLDSLLEESTDVVRETLLQENWFSFERFTLYRGLWSTLFNRQAWIEREKLVLTEAKETEGRILALAHLAFLQKKDAEAIDHINSLGPIVLPYSFAWIRSLTASEDWNRARLWVNYSGKLIKKYVSSISSYEGRRHMARTYLKEITVYSEKNDESAYSNALKNLLPYSFVEYDHYLLSAQRYHEWVDLQMFVGYDISDVNRQVIKEIEEYDRSALLPFYHQAVVKAVAQKNRPSYKQAVKYLRKLRTAYRRLNKLDSWENYIKKLSESHKRLRAFQEELQRAKLIVPTP